MDRASKSGKFVKGNKSMIPVLGKNTASRSTVVCGNQDVASNFRSESAEYFSELSPKFSKLNWSVQGTVLTESRLVKLLKLQNRAARIDQLWHAKITTIR